MVLNYILVGCPWGKWHENSWRYKERQNRGRRRPSREKPEDQKKQPCEYCGQSGTHPAGKSCPAYRKKCLKCQKFNHFAVVCRAGGKDKHQKSEQKQPKNKECKKHVKKTTEETASDNSTSSDDEFYSQAGRHLKHVRKIKSGDQAKTVTVQIAQTLESLRFSIRSH